jgi:integrase
MARQNQYLKQRTNSSNWYFQLAVPSHLRGEFGTTVVESLQTPDVVEARQLRDIRLGQWREKFREAEQQLNQGHPLELVKRDPNQGVKKINSGLRSALNHAVHAENEMQIARREDLDYMVAAENLVFQGVENVSLALRRELNTLFNMVSKMWVAPEQVDHYAIQQFIRESEQVAKKTYSYQDLADEYIAEKREDGLPEKTIKMYEGFINALEKAKWDGNALKKQLEADGKSPTTIWNYFNNLKTFANWLSEERDIKLKLPKVPKSIKGKISTRDVFTEEEILKIANSDIDATEKWVCMIAAYQGFRLAEILQLRFLDIRERHGVWSFEINDRNGKSVKNNATVRSVPIHPWLINHGFLDYWKKYGGWAKVFPVYDGDISNSFSKHINRHIKKILGMKTSETATGKKVFHSFRHTFRDYCREAGLDSTTTNILGGWSGNSGEGEKYGKGLSMKRKLEFLEQVKILPEEVKMPVVENHTLRISGNRVGLRTKGKEAGNIRENGIVVDMLNFRKQRKRAK